MHEFAPEELSAARSKVDDLRQDAYSIVIETLQRSDEPASTLDVFVLYRVNADSYIGGRSVASIHQTLKGALLGIPARMRTNDLLRVSGRPTDYILDFAYYAIEKQTIGA